MGNCKWLVHNSMDSTQHLGTIIYKLRFENVRNRV